MRISELARASGVDVDLRRDQPYLAYAGLFAEGGPGRVVTRTAGDCLSRLEVLLDQVHVEAYGSSMPLNQVAAVTVPAPVPRHDDRVG